MGWQVAKQPEETRDVSPVLGSAVETRMGRRAVEAQSKTRNGGSITPSILKILKTL